jgi:hypothetical protein
MPKRYHGSYEDHDDVRRQEKADAGMVPHHGGAHANMPETLVMKQYPKDSDYMPENLDDTIRGVDHQKSEDNSKRRAHNVPKKV